jgi:hypothetical protein
VLAHPDVDRRQLFNLAACRITHRDPLVLAEDVSATAALRPVLDDLIDSPRRQERTAVTLMAILEHRVCAPTDPCYEQAPMADRSSAGARSCASSLQLTLELLNTALQLLNTTVHPQQHLHDDLPAGVIDHLRLGALHALVFDTAGLCPADPLNTY